MHPAILLFYVMSVVAACVFVLALYDTFVPKDSHWRWVQTGMVIVWVLFVLALVLAAAV